MKTSAKYQKILVAVDGSETSLHALQESFALVGNWIVTVSVAPVYEGDLHLEGLDDLTALIREPCDTALARAEELARASGAVLKTICAVGEPYERLVALAAQEKCELIVMGAQGHTLLERALVGSVTARVIGHAAQDVLVVPPAARLGWHRLLVALDGSAPSRAAASRALDLAQAYGGELLAVSVLELPLHFSSVAPEIADRMIHENRWLQDLKTRAAARGVPLQCMAGEGEPYREITRLAREKEAGLIIMGSHGRTGLTRLLMGSVTERVIGHSPCPVLVVKEVSSEQ